MELGSTWAFQPIKLCLPQMCFGFIGLSSPQWLIVGDPAHKRTNKKWCYPAQNLFDPKHACSLDSSATMLQPLPSVPSIFSKSTSFKPQCFMALAAICFFDFKSSRQCMPGWGPWPAQFWHQSSQPNGQSPASKQLGHFSGTPAPSSPVLCAGPSGQCWTELLPLMPSPWSALLWTEPISPWAGCWSFDCFSDLGLLHRNWGSHIGFCQAASTSSSRCGWWLGHMNRQQIPCLHWDCRWSRRWSRLLLLLLLGGASHQ